MSEDNEEKFKRQKRDEMNAPTQPPDKRDVMALNPLELLEKNFFLEAGRIDQRTDWFLIFHAILFEAFVASPHVPQGSLLQESIPGLPIGLLGILSSFYWWVTGCRTAWLLRQLGGYLSHAEVTGHQFAQVWNVIYEARRGHALFQWARPAPVFLIALPLLVTLVWLVITLMTFMHWQQICVTGGVVVLLYHFHGCARYHT